MAGDGLGIDRNMTAPFWDEPRQFDQESYTHMKCERASATRFWCGLPFAAADPAVCDHYIPRALGGGDHAGNLVPGAHIL
jgi:hypothetical protein